MGSGLPEFFDAGLHGGAGGPDVVEKDISGTRIYGDVVGYSICVISLSDTSCAIGADLCSTISADKKWLCLAMWTA